MVIFSLAGRIAVKEGESYSLEPDYKGHGICYVRELGFHPH